MNPLLFIDELRQLHQNTIIQWKEHGIQLKQTHFFKLIEENHAFNYQLWHAEDRARRDDMGFEFVYHAKREIDGFNQQRNNRMEMIDAALHKELQAGSAETCDAHSETPGMMIDRLSILALKRYHMGLQCERTDVDEEHRITCQSKLNVIQLQQKHLHKCLCAFLQDVIDYSRTFVVYHQFKMYNDPTLNPELYSRKT